jgi:hypothetical protein
LGMRPEITSEQVEVITGGSWLISVANELRAQGPHGPCHWPIAPLMQIKWSSVPCGTHSGCFATLVDLPPSEFLKLAEETATHRLPLVNFHPLSTSFGWVLHPRTPDGRPSCAKSKKEAKGDLHAASLRLSDAPHAKNNPSTHRLYPQTFLTNGLTPRSRLPTSTTKAAVDTCPLQRGTLGQNKGEKQKCDKPQTPTPQNTELSRSSPFRQD